MKKTVIVVVNLFRPRLISFRTLKRKSEIRWTVNGTVFMVVMFGALAERGCFFLGRKHNSAEFVPFRRAGRSRDCTQIRRAHKLRAFVWDIICSELVDMDFDQTIGFNLISERFLGLLGYKASVRRFNEKLKGTFAVKNRKLNVLGYIRAMVEIGSFKKVFNLINVGQLDYDVVLRAQKREEIYGLMGTENESMICHECHDMQSVLLTFERLPVKGTISLDEETGV